MRVHHRTKQSTSRFLLHILYGKSRYTGNHLCPAGTGKRLQTDVPKFQRIWIGFPCFAGNLSGNPPVSSSVFIGVSTFFCFCSDDAVGLYCFDSLVCAAALENLQKSFSGKTPQSPQRIPAHLFFADHYTCVVGFVPAAFQ